MQLSVKLLFLIGVSSSKVLRVNPNENRKISVIISPSWSAALPWRGGLALGLLRALHLRDPGLQVSVLACLGFLVLLLHFLSLTCKYVPISDPSVVVAHGGIIGLLKCQKPSTVKCWLPCLKTGGGRLSGYQWFCLCCLWFALSEIHLPTPPIANFDSKMVPKNCANFVLNCAAIFKLCAVRHFAEF